MKGFINWFINLFIKEEYVYSLHPTIKRVNNNGLVIPTGMRTKKGVIEVYANILHFRGRKVPEWIVIKQPF